MSTWAAHAIWPRPSIDTAALWLDVPGRSGDFGEAIIFARRLLFARSFMLYNRLVETSPTVPGSPSSSQGLSDYSGPTTALVPVRPRPELELERLHGWVSHG